MKQKFTFLIAAVMLLMMIGLPWKVVGQAKDDVKVTITISSFTDLPSGSASYATYNWTQDGINGKATIFANQSSTSMQFNASNYLFYSTSAISGVIKSIKLTTASGTNRTYVVYGSTSAYSGSGTSYGTQIGSQTVTTSGTTYTVSSGEYTYFTIVKSGSGAGYLSSVEVTYTSSGGGTPTTYTVTFDAGDGTFVGSTDFPNTSNTIAAGTYTLPSATPPTGYTFNGWTATGINTPVSGSYTVSNNVAFTANYTQNGGGNTADVTYDFSSTDNFLTSYPGSTHPGTGNSNNLATFYYTNGDEFTASGNSSYFNSDGYFILGKTNATLQLPTFDFAVEKIVITGRSGASGSVVQNIYVSDVAVSTATTGATGTNTYNIASIYQAAGPYTLKVTSNHNTQITKIEIFAASTGPTQLAAPTNFSASNGVGCVNLSWTAVEHASSYTLEYDSNNSFSSATSIENIPNNATSYSPTLAAGTYYFRLKAVGDDNNYTTSGWSETASAASVSSVTLSAPTLTATAGNGQVTLEWEAIANATNYTIEYANNNEFSNSTQVTESNTTRTITGLTNGTVYYFRGKTNGNDTTYNSSEFGDAVNATPVMPQLATPTLTVTAGNAQVTPTWESINNVSSYTIEYATTNAFTSPTAVNNANSGTSITGLTNNTQYYFRLKAIGDNTNYASSEWSATVTATPINVVVDVLDRELTGVTGTSYASWNNKPGSASEAVYAGNSAGGNSSIQLRGSDNSGIISTISGGKVKKVVVTWNTNTTNGRTLDIYGSNTAYTSVSQLYNANTSGTKLGSIVYGTSTELTVSGNYKYIGLRSNSGAMYLSEIDITWQPNSVKNPSFTPAAGTYTSAQDVTISCETTGAAIYYTLDGTTPTSSSTPYTAAIHVTEQTTIKAIAIKDDESSSVVSATYNIVTPLTTMDEILAQATVIGSETPQDVYVTLNNWVVTGVGGFNSKNAYVTDNAGKGFIIYNESHGFAVNDKLNGTVKAALQLYNGSSEFTTLTTNTDNISVSNDGTVTVYTKTIDQLSAINTGSIVTIKDLTYDEDNDVLTDGTNTIIPYTTLWNGASFTDGKKYHVTGLFVQNGDDKRINPRSAADIVLAADMSATDFSSLTTFTYIVDYGPSAAQTIGVLCGDLGTNNLRATASSDFEVSLTGNANDYHEYVDMVPENGDVMSDLYVRLKAGLTTDAHNGTLTFTATNLTTVEQALTGTVSATVTYDIIVDDNIDHGSIESDKAVAEAGETVNLTAHPDQYYQLGEWSVTDGVNDIYVVNNQFEMPDADVMVSATFTRIQYTITYSVNENTSAIPAGTFNAGEVANLPTATVAGQTFIGWSTSASSTEVVKNYIPTANATLYAVFGDLIEGDLTITKDTENFPDAYGEANTFTEYTLEGKKFKIQQAYVNQGKLQWRASGNSNGTGTIYNSEDFGRITSIVLVYNSSDNYKNFTIIAGTAENPTEGTSITPTTSDLTYTFDLSDGTYHYFVMANGTNAGYLDQIVINYEVSYPFTELTTVTGASSIGSIAATERVVVTNNGVLTLTGTNNGTAANLIIEDGGQLVTTNSVKATFNKTTETSSAKPTNNWYAISSPVNNVAIESFAQGTHNVYRYDEPTRYWHEYHSALGDNPAYDNLANGCGYLYRSTVANIAFEGDVNVDDAKYTLKYTNNGDNMNGFNLIGNPFSYDIYKNKEIPNTNLEDNFYILETNGGWTLSYDYGTAELAGPTKIKPNTGILVQAKSTANDNILTISKSSKGGENKYGKDQISFRIENSEYSDIACVIFKEGHGLNKVNHRNAEIPMLYITKDGENFASANMPDNTNVINIGFEAKTMGQYTFSLKAEGRYSYMHLIDKLTGDDVDMLLEDSYTFMGSPRDRKDRFVLRLNYNAAGIDTESDIFAYQSGSDILVSGEGELQIFDVMGRLVMNQRINGVQTINGINNGVYIFKLEGKTQKIVVR